MEKKHSNHAIIPKKRNEKWQKDEDTRIKICISISLIEYDNRIVGAMRNEKKRERWYTQWHTYDCIIGTRIVLFVLLSYCGDIIMKNIIEIGSVQFDFSVDRMNQKENTSTCTFIKMRIL